MSKGPDGKVPLSSTRALLVVQAIIWTIVLIVFAWRGNLAHGDDIYPTCPSVLTALRNQHQGVPFNLLGLAEGLIFIGFLWFCSGLLAGAYSKWPRFFLSFRVSAGRVFGPSARRAGPVVMLAGCLLLVALQVGCEVG